MKIDKNARCKDKHLKNMSKMKPCITMVFKNSTKKLATFYKHGKGSEMVAV